MAFRLPPLNTLRLFEAAARLGSFKEAAQEANVTPSAVSHAVQTLEDWLGTELFQRTARGLILGPAGKAYGEEIRAALALIATATERLPGRRATGSLAISAAPSFANCWLLPRLPRFAEAHPEIAVHLDTAKHYVDFPLEGVDLAIRRGTAARAGENWIRLVQERVQPVAAPAVLAAHPAASLGALLQHLPLILVTSIRDDWGPWFAARGEAMPDNVRVMRVDTIQLAADAAAHGLGVAMGRLPVLSDFLADGRLAPVEGPALPIAEAYWLAGAEHVFERPEAKRFRAWLLAELGADA
ncbi:LysR substrate-binding domain-containing protein [Zavarzinia sp.]|uniref:LysR substrate-binding domain-containing protein n=1 Tax=Zavarzinia sp. TaxID=2027920 RepID=UPI003569403C